MDTPLPAPKPREQHPPVAIETISEVQSERGKDPDGYYIDRVEQLKATNLQLLSIINSEARRVSSDPSTVKQVKQATLYILDVVGRANEIDDLEQLFREPYSNRGQST